MIKWLVTAVIILPVVTLQTILYFCKFIIFLPFIVRGYRKFSREMDKKQVEIAEEFGFVNAVKWRDRQPRSFWQYTKAISG